jgi:hypothetical protein
VLDNDGHIDDWMICDKLDAAFDTYRDDVLYKSGLDELRKTLSDEEMDALERFLVYPIYELIDCDGKKQPIKDFRRAVSNVVRLTAYLHRVAGLLEQHKQELQRQLNANNKTVYICVGIIGTLAVLILYFLSRWQL